MRGNAIDTAKSVVANLEHSIDAILTTYMFQVSRGARRP